MIINVPLNSFGLIVLDNLTHASIPAYSHPCSPASTHNVEPELDPLTMVIGTSIGDKLLPATFKVPL
jgi:hypothetical protein